MFQKRYHASNFILLLLLIKRAIYDQAIVPIVNEVLDGFNCTVFAYGDSCTGKTYTMEGGMRNKGGDFPAEAAEVSKKKMYTFLMIFTLFWNGGMQKALVEGELDPILADNAGAEIITKKIIDWQSGRCLKVLGGHQRRP
ncbi:hypothetical protein ACFE04_030860 [Oxalis oulophora]